jgi:hypothetical protein
MDEGEMSLMEVTHGWDEAEWFGEGREGGAEGREGSNGLHGKCPVVSFQCSVYNNELKTDY